MPYTKVFLPLLLILLAGAFPYGPVPGARAQDSLSVRAQPTISLQELTLLYYNINWTDAQWDTLAGRQVELFYLIDRYGEPFLRTVRGVDKPAILDSLATVTERIPYFEPATEGGRANEDIFGFYFTFPEKTQPRRWVGNAYNYALAIDSAELREAYRFDGLRFTMNFTGYAVHYFGRAGSYITRGPGFGLGFVSKWSRRWGAGFDMGIHGANIRRPVPEDALGRTEGSVSAGFITALIDRTLTTDERREWSLRGELGLGFTGISSRDEELEDDDFEFTGLHSGLVLRYTKPFGGTPAAMDGRGKVRQGRFAYSVFGGFRHCYVGDRSLTGWYATVGASVGIWYGAYEKR